MVFWNRCRIQSRDATGGVAVLDLKGALTREEPSRKLHQRVIRLLAAGRRRILLNFQGIRSINHQGLGVLVSIYYAAQQRGCEVKLVRLNRKVLQALDSMLLTPLFDLHETEGSALISFHSDQQGLRATEDSFRRRHSRRVPLSVLLRAHWTTGSGRRTSEDTLTEVMNGAGARIRLKSPVDVGAEMEIANLYNRQKSRARVVWVATNKESRGKRVGIKFLTSNAAAWCNEFTV